MKIKKDVENSLKSKSLNWTYNKKSHYLLELQTYYMSHNAQILCLKFKNIACFLVTSG